jgi:hypothetical protein
VPLVSIVMPAWKPRPGWLRAAVDSALDQTDCKIELIVVDDGSPAPVAGLLADVEDPRLRVVRVDHGGAAHGRNAGVREARGRFLRFVDADDLLEPASTARLAHRAGEDGVIAYGATLVCDDQLRALGVKSSQLEGRIADACLLYRFDVMHVSMLFPRPVVEAVGDWDTTLSQCEDWDYVLRALEHAPVRGEQQIATFYRRHGASLGADLEAALQHESRVVDRYFERHPEQAGTSLERQARAKLLIVRAKARPPGMNRREQLAAVGRALALHPQRVAEELGREAVDLARRAAYRNRRGRPRARG